MKVSTIQPQIMVGAFEQNAKNILELYRQAVEAGAEIVVGPESAIAGYCQGDQRLYRSFILEHDKALNELVAHIGDVPLVIGIDALNTDGGKPFYNTAVFIENGRILHSQHKTNLATGSVFDDDRWYESNPEEISVFRWKGKNCAMLVCQDIWERYDTLHQSHYFLRDPVTELQGREVELLFVPNASPYYWGKGRVRFDMVKAVADYLSCAVVYANYSGGHDELVFDGRSFVMNAQGTVVGAGRPFQSNDVVVAELDGPAVPYPFGDDIADLGEALVVSLRDYVNKSGICGVVLGLSGGIDSAVCAGIAVLALGAERVIGIRMPSQYSSQGSLDDAEELARNLGIRCDTIPIAGLYDAFAPLLFNEIGFGVSASAGDVTEENLQARIRGNIVMAYANKYGYMSIATGNKSEFAVGYSTLYGDMCGGFALLKDTFKLEVYRLAEWLNAEGEIIPQNSITKPPSAELRPDQKDTDSLPDYPVLDAILRGYIEEYQGYAELVARGFPPAVVQKVIGMTDRAEFKRRQAPPGPFVTSGGLAWLNRQYPMQTAFRP